MTIAAIDYGKRHLGIAAADPSGIVVYPVGLVLRHSLKRDLATLNARLRELEASRVIVGLLNTQSRRLPSSVFILPLDCA